MIKNRFFKTTNGVPFELVIGKQYPGTLFADFKAMITDAVLHDIGAFVVESDATQPKGVATGAALSAADKKKPLLFAWADQVDTNGDATILSVTPLIAETIKAELVPYKAPTKQVTALALTSGSLSTNQILSFKLVETTPGNQPLPTWDYEQLLTGGGTAAWAKIIIKINEGKEEEFFTASASANGITITSKDDSRHFKLVATVLPTRADYADYGIIYTSTTSTPAYAGSGTLQHLLELQKEANVRRGIGHYYTDKISFGTNPSDFGLPIDTVTATGTTQWDIVALTGLKSEFSPTPKGIHQNKHYIFIAVPAGQGAAIIAMFA